MKIDVAKYSKPTQINRRNWIPSGFSDYFRQQYFYPLKNGLFVSFVVFEPPYLHSECCVVEISDPLNMRLFDKTIGYIWDKGTLINYVNNFDNLSKEEFMNTFG